MACRVKWCISRGGDALKLRFHAGTSHVMGWVVVREGGAVSGRRRTAGKLELTQ